MLNKKLQILINKICLQLFPDEAVKDFIIKTGAKIEYPKERKFGDYATPVAMQLAKMLKKNPLEIAEKICVELSKTLDFSKVEAVKPGFINVFLSDDVLFKELKSIIEEKQVYSRPDKNGEKIIFEYVSANPTGPLHIGHARWAALGDTLSRILTWSGFDVYREFYVNDAGVQVENLNKTVDALKNNRPIPEDGYHGEYVKDCLDYAGEPIDFFLDQQKETLKKFRVEFDNYFSEKNDLHKKGLVELAVKSLKEKNLTYEKEGALWFRTTDFGDDKDRVLIKSDGTYTYFAPDVAYHKTKVDRGFNRIIDFFGADHHGYIRRIQSAVKAISVHETKFDVIIGQLVYLFREGEPVKLSKRAGTIITLEEVMEEIGIDAMRYFLTMRKADTSFDFDIELAKKQSSEKPVFYIQYAFARISSIKRKAAEKNVEISFEFITEELNDFERDLIVKLLKYPEEIVDCANTLEPHRITNYLYEIASLFHKFFEECKIIDENNVNKSRMRMLIAFSVRQCLETLLSLLAIEAPERM